MTTKTKRRHGMEENGVPDQKAAKRLEFEALKVDDKAGVEWIRTASGKWTAAQKRADAEGGIVLDYYAPDPLPDFTASAPAHVHRQLLGRFLVNRDTLVVHDCYRATEECGIDGIVNGTFYHFWGELVDTAIEEIPCSYCLEVKGVGQ